MGFVRLLAISFVAGALLGIGGRLVMRLIAVAAEMAGGFSPGGTLEVVGYIALIGAPVAFAFLLVRRRIPVRPPWAGAMFGLLLFLVLAMLRLPTAQPALAATPDLPAFTALAFGSRFVLWGALLDLLSTRRPR